MKFRNFPRLQRALTQLYNVLKLLHPTARAINGAKAEKSRPLLCTTPLQREKIHRAYRPLLGRYRMYTCMMQQSSRVSEAKKNTRLRASDAAVESHVRQMRRIVRRDHVRVAIYIHYAHYTEFVSLYTHRTTVMLLQIFGIKASTNTLDYIYNVVAATS